MTRKEYIQLNKAIRLLMEDEPRNEEEAKLFEGGFLSAMEVLDDMRRAYFAQPIKNIDDSATNENTKRRMINQYTVKGDCCQDCIHYTVPNPHFSELSTCWALRKRRITTKGIPSWCPLDDAEKK